MDGTKESIPKKGVLNERIFTKAIPPERILIPFF